MSHDSHTYLYSLLQGIVTLWVVPISHSAEGRRLSWPGWLITYMRWCSHECKHPSQY